MGLERRFKKKKNGKKRERKKREKSDLKGCCVAKEKE